MYRSKITPIVFPVNTVFQEKIELKMIKEGFPVFSKFSQRMRNISQNNKHPEKWCSSSWFAPFFLPTVVFFSLTVSCCSCSALLETLYFREYLYLRPVVTQLFCPSAAKSLFSLIFPKDTLSELPTSFCPSFFILHCSRHKETTLDFLL